MFSVEVRDLRWLEGASEEEDICLHGDVTIYIGDRIYERPNTTVSSTALYLLKSLTQDHNIYRESTQMLPCCGFFMIADGTLSTVDIMGCNDGIDWSVIHTGSHVKLVTETDDITYVSLEEYKKTVFGFADEIEAFYLKSKPKKDVTDAFIRNGYNAFWNEWHRRRNELK
jgi:hypothetical protein